MRIKKIHKGSSDITANFARVYRGSELIWEKETDPIYEDTTLSIDLSNSEELSPYLNIFKENDMLMTVDWGDGTTTTSTAQGSQDLPHTYGSVGEYIITISTKGNWYFDDYCLGESAYNKYLMTANLNNSVTSIGDRAFSYCSSLTSIVIPDSVSSIGIRAFDNCSSLTSIVIPNSVTSIGSWAFFNCSSLTSIVIPDSVSSIGDCAFSYCSSLTSIVIPDSVTSIGDGIIDYCANLTDVYFAGTTETWVERFGTKGKIFYALDSAKTTVIVQCSNGDVEYEWG